MKNNQVPWSSSMSPSGLLGFLPSPSSGVVWLHACKPWLAFPSPPILHTSLQWICCDRLDTWLGVEEILPITIRGLSQTHTSLPTCWERRRPSPWLLVWMCPLPRTTQVSSLAVTLPRAPEQPIQHSKGWTKQQCYSSYSCKSGTDNREDSSALTPTAIGWSGHKQPLQPCPSLSFWWKKYKTGKWGEAKTAENKLKTDRAAKIAGCSESKFSSLVRTYNSSPWLPKKLFLLMEKYKLEASLRMKSVLEAEASSSILRSRDATMLSI